MFSLKFILQDEDQLSFNFLFFILIIQINFFAFQFLSRGIRIYFPILAGVKNERITS